MPRIVDAFPIVGKKFTTNALWQYDAGQAVRVHFNGLPLSYHVDISNKTRGDAESHMQTGDVIDIPRHFLESGDPVFIWIGFVDADSRTTTLYIMSPVMSKTKPTYPDPEPEEQSQFDQAIAALNTGVETVQGIADAIPDTINDALEAAKESGEFDGDAGFSPEVTVAPIQGGHRITITDANGTHTVDVLDGTKGDTGRGIVSVQKTGTAGFVDTYTITYTDSTTSTFTVTNGQDGTPGTDGTTFTPAVSSEGVISWTNDGGKTNPQPVDIKGPKGDDGTSPTVSVADITGGHRVTVTDANGTRSFDVMDGDDYILTAADKAEIAQQAAEEVNVPVQDVQVSGVSVLTDGVANVPVANMQGNPGVIKMVNGNGIGLSGQGNLTIVGAISAAVKNGTNALTPIVPSRQHESTFYGLAKAAGDTTQSASSNPVGTYTDAAKVAIQIMLGISAIIGTVEAGTASKPYAVGDIFLHGGALYKASSAIGTGDAIVPGTNCAQTTIIEILKGV